MTEIRNKVFSFIKSEFGEGLIVFLLLLAISFICYGEYLFLGPRNNHLSAQTDRACIARCYFENGLNFFKPQICNQGNSDGTIGTEFPILYYISAVFMKLYGIEHPFFIRFFSLLFSLAGLLYIYKIFRLVKVLPILSFLGILIVYSSPIFFFYQANFNSNHVAFGFSCISLYHIIKYRYEANYKYILIFNLFSTFAALIKTSFATYFLIGNILFFYFTKYEIKTYLKQIYFIIIGIGLYFSHYNYNMYLNKVHNSFGFKMDTSAFDTIPIFLFETGPMLAFWKDHILIYWVYYFIIALFLFVGTFNRVLISRNKFVFISLVFFGNFAVYYLMGKAYSIHDYYIIDTFYIPLSLFILALFYFFQKIVKYQSIIWALSLFFIYFLYHDGKFVFGERTLIRNIVRDDWIVRDFENSSEILNNLSINKDEKVMVFDPWGPDAIFYYLNRKGVSIDHFSAESINLYKSKGYRHMIIQNCSFQTYPEKISAGMPFLEKIYDSDKFKVFKLK